MSVEIIYKICSICKDKKELCKDNFHKDSSKKSGFKSICKKCDNKRVSKNNKKRNWKTHSRKLNSYRYNDTLKGREFSLNKEYFEDTLKMPCYYCGFPSTGLDRLNNCIGHTAENCVPCCTECNTARMDNFTPAEMKIVGEAIKKVKQLRNN